MVFPLPPASFCDTENVSFANDMVITMSMGKLDVRQNRDTLCRSVLLKNLLHDRVQEKTVGLQCYGPVRMHEVELMVQRQQDQHAHTAARGWDDHLMDADEFRHHAAFGMGALAGPADDDDDATRLGPYDMDFESHLPSTTAADKRMVEDDDECDKSATMMDDASTDDDDDDDDDDEGWEGDAVVDAMDPLGACGDEPIDTLGASGHAGDQLGAIVTAPPRRQSPVRIKLVLGKPHPAPAAPTTATPLKRARDAGMDVTNVTVTRAASCGKRARLHSGSQSHRHAWHALSGLPSVF